MSRFLSRLTGGGVGGIYIVGDRLTRLLFPQPIKDNFDLIMLGALGRNRHVGGSSSEPIDASGAGTFDLITPIPFAIDNTGNQFSGFSDANGATLVVQVRFRVRVSDAAISVTPKVYNETDSALATVSGNSACTAILDDYSGTAQQQTVALTLPSGAKTFRPQITIAGTPAPGLKVWATAILDMYVQN